MLLSQILDDIIGLQKCKLGNDKLEYLKLHNYLEFKSILHWLLSNQVTLGLKKLPPIGKVGSNDVEFTELEKLVHELANSNINDSLRNKVLEFIGRMSLEYQPVLSALLCKTLKLGVTAKNVNKAYGHTVINEFKCMLADVTEDTEYPAYVETKYDGVRCLATVNQNKCTLYTRHGNVIKLPNIEHEILLLAKGQDLVFDGELITATRTSVSGKINSIMHTGYTPLKAEGIIMRIFDVIPYSNFESYTTVTKPLSSRKWELDILFSRYQGELLQNSEEVLVTNDTQLKNEVNKLINLGEEGAIVKPVSSPYVFKRSSFWGKHKAINTTTLKVVGVTQGKNARIGKVGALVCESADSKVQVNVGSGLTDDDLVALTDAVIGKYVEVVFNVLIRGEDSDMYSLFLPRLKKDDWLRIDKTEADTLDKIIKEHIGKPMI